MTKALRFAIVLLLALMASSMVTPAAAQEIDVYTLRVAIALHPEGKLTGGQICFEEDNYRECQDLAVSQLPDVPGQEGYYEFQNIPGDSGAVFVENADPYEGSQGVILTEGINVITLDLYASDAPTPTPAPNLPDTGTGTTPDGGSTSFLLITGMLGAAGALAAGAAFSRRVQR